MISTFNKIGLKTLDKSLQMAMRSLKNNPTGQLKWENRH